MDGTDTCERCAYWKRISFAQGECRRCAPAVFPYHEMATGRELVRAWPVTEYVDWCGEHTPLKPGAARATGGSDD